MGIPLRNLHRFRSNSSSLDSVDMRCRGVAVRARWPYRNAWHGSKMAGMAQTTRTSAQHSSSYQAPAQQSAKALVSAAVRVHSVDMRCRGVAVRARYRPVWLQCHGPAAMLGTAARWLAWRRPPARVLSTRRHTKHRPSKAQTHSYRPPSTCIAMSNGR